jgi:hypothetical protein
MINLYKIQIESGEQLNKTCRKQIDKYRRGRIFQLDEIQ